ncbi:glycosyl hydrolase 2 galactose-binding domain-containing protein [Ruania rhizosphaerae]|uniref:glycosyl hydrolase 2 galactose-binding domain-containing protein n=1 Tax=Ruania rhizosphaerae TaxID=1840413 RepID=UPI00135BFD09|nr:glycoside hydrolase family 2 TIM barrel-domain containing protein [Ruania rhizosphaerae]
MEVEIKEWTLEGWRPWEWQMAASVESGTTFTPELGPFPAAVPGDVRTVLRQQEVVPEPFHGTASRASEFIERRHWVYQADLGSFARGTAEPVDIVFDAIDGPCLVLFDGAVVARHDNVHLSFTIRVELDGAERPLLEVVMLEPPTNLGQVCRTDEILPTRSRFCYGWDWTPRMVQIGMPGRVTIKPARAPRLQLRELHTGLRGSDGVLTLELEPSVAAYPSTEVSVELRHSGCTVHHSRHQLVSTITVNVPDAQPWHVDDPQLYELVVTSWIGESPVSLHRSVGFSHVEWRNAPGDPEGAEGWLLHLNGEPLPFVGVNWVPIRPDFASVRDEEYIARLTLYRELGFTMIRVWGGATRERDLFYDLCDRLGILVWQDLPLSSSGINNSPPESEEFATLLDEIAKEWRQRLMHHPSLVVWCGGNELTVHDHSEDRPGRPITADHPGVGRALRTLAAGGRWKVVPATPSGPRFGWTEQERGLGLHHDVHGPWETGDDADDWASLWALDDARLRSEVGVAGASPVDLLQEFDLWNSGTANWSHSSSWWLTGREEASPEWVEMSQLRQQHLLVDVVHMLRRRQKECGGVLFWLGHDTFPCAVSLALVDFHGRPKPAAVGIAQALREWREDMRSVAEVQ